MRIFNAISHRRRSVFRLSGVFLGCPCVRDHVLTIKVYEHGILQTACGNFYHIYNFGAVEDRDELIRF